MVRGITFSEQLTTSGDFAHFQNTFLDRACGITKGCRVTSDTEKVYISAGYFVVAGRFINITGVHEVTTNGPTDVGELYCSLVFEVDLSQFNTVDKFNQGAFKIVTSIVAYPTLVQQDLDAGGTIYQMPFARFKNTVSGITNFQDTSIIVNVSDIWSRVANQNADYRVDFEMFYSNQKQTVTNEFLDYYNKFKNDYATKLNEFINKFEEEFDSLKEDNATAKEVFDLFFEEQSAQIRGMIEELKLENYITNGAYQEDKKDLLNIINGFVGKATVFNVDGSITETDANGYVKRTTFPTNMLASEQLSKNGVVLLTKNITETGNTIKEVIT